MKPSRRMPVKKSKSVNQFKNNSNRTKAPNMVAAPMRGGYRF